MLESKSGDGLLRKGIYVFAGLVVLTALEFAVAISNLPGWLLLIVAVIKVALILIYYMHVRGVFNLDIEEEH
jgi:heme/copper-type cytochrome/quinol oxidase subunit 4